MKNVFSAPYHKTKHCIQMELPTDHMILFTVNDIASISLM